MSSQSTEVLGSLFGDEIHIPNTHGLLGKVSRAKEAAQNNNLILPNWRGLIRELQPIGRSNEGREWHHAFESKRISIDGIFAQFGSDELVAVGYSIHWPGTKLDPNILEISRIQAEEHDLVPIHPVTFFNFRGMVGVSQAESFLVAGFPDFSNGQLSPALKDLLSLETVNPQVSRMLRNALDRFEKGTLRTIDIQEIVRGESLSRSLIVHPFQEKTNDPSE